MAMQLPNHPLIVTVECIGRWHVMASEGRYIVAERGLLFGKEPFRRGTFPSKATALASAYDAAKRDRELGIPVPAPVCDHHTDTPATHSNLGRRTDIGEPIWHLCQRCARELFTDLGMAEYRIR